MAQHYRDGSHGEAGFLAQLRTYPVNITLNADGSPREIASSDLSLNDDRIAAAFRFRLQPLETFGYNPLDCLRAVIPLDPKRSKNFQHIIVSVLPVGTVSAIFLRPVDRVPRGMKPGTEEEDYFKASNGFSGLVYDLIAGLERLGAIAHARVAPMDRFMADEPVSAAFDRAWFERTMEWRAWGSGGFVSFVPSEGRGGEVGQESNDSPGSAAASNPFNGGIVRRIYNNCYHWTLECQPYRPTTSDRIGDLVSLDVECCEREIARAFEPVVYAISLRSICSSGTRNVRNITRAFAQLRDSRISIGDLRRYIGEIRLALLSVADYEESSDKLSREIYRLVSEDVGNQKAAERLRANLIEVADEIHVVQNERAERRHRRANVFALVLTGLFGVSALVDIFSFLSTPIEGIRQSGKILALGGYSVAFLVVLLVLSLQFRK